MLKDMLWFTEANNQCFYLVMRQRLLSDALVLNEVG